MSKFQNIRMKGFQPVILIGLMAIGLSTVTFAAQSPRPTTGNGRTTEKAAIKLPTSDEMPADGASFNDDMRPQRSLGRLNPPSSQSPGYAIGHTWYDKQSNGTIGRMIDWGYDDVNGLIIHFSWMFMPDRVFADRAYAYASYFSSSSTLPAFLILQDSTEYAGYVGIDVDTSNRAIVGGHCNDGTGYAPHFYYETGVPGEGTFDESRITDPPFCAGVHADYDYCPIWPKFRYQDIPGHDPVTHVFAQESRPAAGDPQAISYFRKVGVGATGVWDNPPYVVDTIQDISQDVACSNTSGKVALIWTANGCPDLAVCDTCSDNTDSYNVINGQWENDVYYQISYDFGASWEPRVNMIKHHHEADFWLSYTDLTSLIDSDDNLHVGYNATQWGMDEGEWTALGYSRDCRLLHWSETIGFETGTDGYSRAKTQIVADLIFDYETAIALQCEPGSWNLMGSKMTVSECDGRLYYMWVQFNDPDNGIYDDCAQRAWEGTTSGSANGELFLSVSSGLDGCSWDLPRNLTNSYTPHCDSIDGVGGRCDCDWYPSMPPFGTNHPANLPSDSIIVDPSGSYTGEWFLPVQYIADPDPGRIVGDEGTWQMTDVMWFQLACVPPVANAIPNPSYHALEYPAYIQSGGALCSTLVLENTGNEDVMISTSVNVYSGHPEGAITTTFPASFLLPSGCMGNSVTAEICAGNGLITSEWPEMLVGNIAFEGDFDGSPLTIGIRIAVADPDYMPRWDTIYCDDGSKAPALALTVGADGNLGRRGEERVNLDYFEYGDCAWYDDENETNPFLGDPRVYLYDASPVVLWLDTEWVYTDYSMYGRYPGGGGFTPSPDPVQEYPDWMAVNQPVDADMVYHVFFAKDSTIKIEQVTMAPGVIDPTFMIQATRFLNLADYDMLGLAIGELLDWDIPSDSEMWNGDGYDATRNLMYQTGEEYGQDDLECTRNDMRAGGLAVLDIYENGVLSQVPPHGMYCMDNATQVYPLEDFHKDSLWFHMEQYAGFTLADSAQWNDLHMVATYRWNHTLEANGGDLIVYTVLATTYNGGPGALSSSVDEARDWLDPQMLCCHYVGDIKHDGDNGGVPLIDDLVYLVTFMFQGGPCEAMCDDNPTPGCNSNEVAFLPEADINGDGAALPLIDDLVYLVTYMFQDGPEPVGWIDYNTPACNK